MKSIFTFVREHVWVCVFVFYFHTSKPLSLPSLNTIKTWNCLMQYTSPEIYVNAIPILHKKGNKNRQKSI